MTASACEMTRVEIAVESLRLSGRLRLKVMGTSMLPAIRPGSYASILTINAASAQPGDVVLVRSCGGVRLHRLVRVDGSFVITRGDNNDSDDAPVRTHDLLGVLSRVEAPRRWFQRSR